MFIYKEGMPVHEALAVLVWKSSVDCLKFYKYIPRLGNDEETINHGTLMKHDFPVRTVSLTKEQILVGAIGDLIKRIEKDFVLSVLSQTDFKNRYHIPMMDFTCQPNDSNLVVIKDILARALEKPPKGIILNSGKSYHFYGSDVIDEKLLFRFYGRCLLASRHFIDHRYIGHRILDKCGVLRISAGGVKTEIPKLVCVL